MKTALKINKQQKKKKQQQQQQDKLKSTQQQIDRQKSKINRKEEVKKTKEREEKKKKKIKTKVIQLLTVAPEHMTLACDLTHVLQVPNTEHYHTYELDGLGLYVRSSLLIDKTTLGQAPLHCFSEIKDCRVVMPENRVSKLSSPTGLGLYVGLSHPKAMSEMTKTPWKTMKIFG